LIILTNCVKKMFNYQLINFISIHQIMKLLMSSKSLVKDSIASYKCKQ
jgi:hypothetical protein